MMPQRFGRFRAAHQQEAARRRKEILPAPGNPASLTSLVAAYLEHITVRHFSGETVALRRRLLRPFLAWAAERGVTEGRQVTAAIAQRYQRWMFYQYKTKAGQPLSSRGQRGRLIALRSFFRWAVQQGHLVANPAADIEMPRQDHRLPRSILSRGEVAAILAQPNVTTSKGIRDRAMLEVFYSTAMRRMELAGLALDDIERERGLILIRGGKGAKDRYVPIGATALRWLDRYIFDVRPTLSTEPDDGTVFLNVGGEYFGKSGMGFELRRYIEAAGIGKRGSCHLLRHACATHLLEAGCDVRFVQELLGHAQLSTTAIYTHVAITALKKVHGLFHPLEQRVSVAGQLPGASAPDPGADAPGGATKPDPVPASRPSPAR